MGDSISEAILELRMLQRNSRNIEEEVACGRRLVDARLLGPSLFFNENFISLIRRHNDYFFSQSEGNETVTDVSLQLDSLLYQDDDFCDKVGSAIGNLQALGKLHIFTPYSFHHYEGEDFPSAVKKRLGRILNPLQQRITLIFNARRGERIAWREEDIRSLARAIHGHPNITSFEGGEDIPCRSLDALYSALVTLPALESITLFNRPYLEDESALANPESLTDLLRLPSLRSVCFCRFYFTRAICQATANALNEGTVITELEFLRCSFSAGNGAAIMADGLARNTSVSYIQVRSDVGEVLQEVLAMALTLNSTVQELIFKAFPYWPPPMDVQDIDLSALYSALGNNKGLKKLNVDGFGSIGECTAMQNGLGMNETLESLELSAVHLDRNADLWRRAFSFLRTNKTLKSLVVGMKEGVAESRVSAFRIDMAAMLQDNVSLESLCIGIYDSHQIKIEDYIAFVAAFQYHPTLKSLRVYEHEYERFWLTDGENKCIAEILLKNYALETLPDIIPCDLAGDAGDWLRLNQAGRRYLIEDGSSISKGVEVLSRVNTDINCVFLHLLENPRLCDRRAVEMATASESNGRSTNPAGSIGGGGGKREEDSVPKGGESRK